MFKDVRLTTAWLLRNTESVYYMIFFLTLQSIVSFLAHLNIRVGFLNNICYKGCKNGNVFLSIIIALVLFILSYVDYYLNWKKNLRKNTITNFIKQYPFIDLHIFQNCCVLCIRRVFILLEWSFYFRGNRNNNLC